MSKENLIKAKLDNLIKLLLIKGIQPSELADNIFLSDYKSITFGKQNGYVVGELIFEEEISGIQTDVKLKYFYNEKTIYRIEEEIFEKTTILWDREQKESDLVIEIVQLLKQHFTLRNVSQFISSLPKELAIKVEKEYERTA
ncbi:hypothetical protein HUN92_03835 [Bacillus firmus]|uniref:hypothetical protein n=1 Tax=Cytobacillus TaxID=2675230 RepID=UPI0011A0F0B3|nr:MULTISPECIES: hypothetical protein [Cytobacillus]MBZ9534534.1 hypothetical protein [Cytobacillus oceanisediminis]NUH82915.1 hypothetical protein [Cytobacillus firmus]